MKNLAVALSAFILTACSSIAQDVASGINNSQLKTTVGKSYSQVMYEHPDFGKLIGRERVGGGSEIMIRSRVDDETKSIWWGLVTN